MGFKIMLIIKKVIRDELTCLLNLIKRLADYEKRPQDAVLTIEDLTQALIGTNPIAYAYLVYQETSPTQPIGFFLYYFNFSTFKGKPSLYLEDFFIDKAYRRLGYGKIIMKHIAQIALAANCHKMHWSVLAWNKPAIKFYQSLGADKQQGSLNYTLNDSTLKQLAE